MLQWKGPASLSSVLLISPTLLNSPVCPGSPVQFSSAVLQNTPVHPDSPVLLNAPVYLGTPVQLSSAVLPGTRVKLRSPVSLDASGCLSLSEILIWVGLDNCGLQNSVFHRLSEQDVLTCSFLQKIKSDRAFQPRTEKCSSSQVTWPEARKDHMGRR